VKEIERQAGE